MQARKIKSEKEALLVIRQTLEMFGHDTSDISDEELKEGATMISKAMANAGVSTKEATNAMSRIAGI